MGTFSIIHLFCCILDLVFDADIQHTLTIQTFQLTERNVHTRVEARIYVFIKCTEIWLRTDIVIIYLSLSYLCTGHRYDNDK